MRLRRPSSASRCTSNAINSRMDCVREKCEIFIRCCRCSVHVCLCVQMHITHASQYGTTSRSNADTPPAQFLSALVQWCDEILFRSLWLKFADAWRLMFSMYIQQTGYCDPMLPFDLTNPNPKIVQHHVADDLNTMGGFFPRLPVYRVRVVQRFSSLIMSTTCNHTHSKHIIQTNTLTNSRADIYYIVEPQLFVGHAHEQKTRKRNEKET